MGYADELQAVSVDEALIDVTSAVAARALAPDEAVEQREHSPADGLVKIRDPAVEIAEKIRDEVRILTDGCEGTLSLFASLMVSIHRHIAQCSPGKTCDSSSKTCRCLSSLTRSDLRVFGTS